MARGCLLAVFLAHVAVHVAGQCSGDEACARTLEAEDDFLELLQREQHLSSPRQSRELEAAQSKRFRSITVPYSAISAPHEAVTGLPANLSMGSLLAYAPHQPVAGDLFVFLPGSKAPCKLYSHLMETIGGEMYSICLPYDNRRFIAALCGANNRCYPDFRLAAFNGSFAHVDSNNIESRLTSALSYLSKHDTGRWSDYLHAASQKPLWSRVRLAGHSQGAGNAAFIGYERRLARVVQFSGVCDMSDWMVKLRQPATPADRFFGFASKWDGMCPLFATQARSWRAEGALTLAKLPRTLGLRDNLTSVSLGGSQTVISDLLPPHCLRNYTQCGMDAHESTCMNWPSRRSPYADGVWQALCGL